MTASLCADQDRLVWRSGRELLQIEAWGPHGLRLTASPFGRIRDVFGDQGALIDSGTRKADIRVIRDLGVIRNGDTEARIRLDGRVSWHASSDGRTLAAETAAETCGRRGRRLTPLAGKLFRAELTLEAYPDERFFGLGQQQHGALNHKGSVVDLLQRNTEVCIPFLLSNRGYGMLWHNPAVGRVEMARNHTRWTAEGAETYDLWFCAGWTPAEILERYTGVTGRPTRMPEWALGLWQCRLRYASQTEVMAVAEEFSRRGLPLGAIVIDGGHWTRMGEWRFDPSDWPDPSRMVDELRSMGIEPVVSVWPTVNQDAETCPEMTRRGLLVGCRRGPDLPERMLDVDKPSWQRLHLYDATCPEARAFLWSRIREGYLAHGVETFWLDADEPEVNPLEPGNLQFYQGPGTAWHNLYPLAHSRAFFDGLAEAGVTRPLTLNRSAWAGSQRYAAAVWSGDIDCSFESLRRQLVAGLNMGLSGIPWWTTDTGGFKGGDPDDEAFRELLVRWFQFATFSPILRMHGYRVMPGGVREVNEVSGAAVLPDMGALSFRSLNGGPNEPWSFGEQAGRILAFYIHLRERLRPYLADLMDEAHDSGAPPMRPVFWEFPHEPANWDIDDQFMLGPALLIAPVLEAGERQRQIAFPEGAEWICAWTGRAVSRDETRWPAPIDRIPVFIRHAHPEAEELRRLFQLPAGRLRL
jgi:alpha-D-xyloside xylohydrolase